MLQAVKSAWPWDSVFLAGVFLFAYISYAESNGGLLPLASAMVVFGLFADRGWSRLIAGNFIMEFVGRISYALYLSHIIVLYVLNWVGVSSTLLKAAVALLVATGLHLGFERPARSWLRGRFSADHHRAFSGDAPATRALST
jgi:peptidoglycan/LPS O-acetylase OafA/YrhL